MAIVNITGTYGGGKTGFVTFKSVPGGDVMAVMTLAGDTSISGSLRATDTGSGVTSYSVVETLSAGGSSYSLSLPSTYASYNVVTSTATLVQTALQVLGAAAAPVKIALATLVGGTVTVADTSITANSIIRLSTKTSGGTVGALFVSARTAATSFAITSTSNTDTSVVEYEILSY